MALRAPPQTRIFILGDRQPRRVFHEGDEQAGDTMAAPSESIAAGKL
jgi:hypothetical protein